MVLFLHGGFQIRWHAGTAKMRFLDVVFFLYFLTHIPIALLFDSQGVFPEQYYPKLVRLFLVYLNFVLLSFYPVLGGHHFRVLGSHALQLRLCTPKFSFQFGAVIVASS